MSAQAEMLGAAPGRREGDGRGRAAGGSGRAFRRAPLQRHASRPPHPHLHSRPRPRPPQTSPRTPGCMASAMTPPSSCPATCLCATSRLTWSGGPSTATCRCGAGREALRGAGAAPDATASATASPRACLTRARPARRALSPSPRQIADALAAGASCVLADVDERHVVDAVLAAMAAQKRGEAPPEPAGEGDEDEEDEDDDEPAAASSSGGGGGARDAQGLPLGAPGVLVIEGVPVLLVEDVDDFAAKLAAAFFGGPSLDMRVVAVAGTSGKTTVSWLVRRGARAAAAGRPHTGGGARAPRLPALRALARRRRCCAPATQPLTRLPHAAVPCPPLPIPTHPGPRPAGRAGPADGHGGQHRVRPGGGQVRWAAGGAREAAGGGAQSRPRAPRTRRALPSGATPRLDQKPAPVLPPPKSPPPHPRLDDEGFLWEADEADPTADRECSAPFHLAPFAVCGRGGRGRRGRAAAALGFPCRQSCAPLGTPLIRALLTPPPPHPHPPPTPPPTPRASTRWTTRGTLTACGCRSCWRACTTAARPRRWWRRRRRQSRAGGWRWGAPAARERHTTTLAAPCSPAAAACPPAPRACAHPQPPSPSPPFLPSTSTSTSRCGRALRRTRATSCSTAAQRWGGARGPRRPPAARRWDRPPPGPLRDCPRPPALALQPRTCVPSPTAPPNHPPLPQAYLESKLEMFDNMRDPERQRLVVNLGAALGAEAGARAAAWPHILSRQPSRAGAAGPK
jgi:hypothetical protein